MRGLYARSLHGVFRWFVVIGALFGFQITGAQDQCFSLSAVWNKYENGVYIPQTLGPLIYSASQFTFSQAKEKLCGQSGGTMGASGSLCALNAGVSGCPTCTNNYNFVAPIAVPCSNSCTAGSTKQILYKYASAAISTKRDGTRYVTLDNRLFLNPVTPNIPIPGQFCHMGCTVNFTGEVSRPGNSGYYHTANPDSQGLYALYRGGTGTQTGDACPTSDPRSDGSSTSDKCPGSVGEVNGKTVCLTKSVPSVPSAGRASNSQGVDPSKSSSSNPNGSTGTGTGPNGEYPGSSSDQPIQWWYSQQTAGGTVTRCYNPAGTQVNCPSWVQDAVRDGDTSGGSSPGSSSGPQDAASGPQTGASGPQSGASGPATDQCDLHPEAIGCAKLGEAPEAGKLGNTLKDFANIPIRNFNSSSACPAPLSFTVLAHQYELSYEGICSSLAKLRLLFVTMGAFLAAWVVADSFKVQ